ncbi:hypothetical protein [Nocardioides sp.]|uniref:hypothetical protein n=1 Tax=Nocardioides sp. TaxID=35761 RepID=UPI003526C5BF
MVIDLLPGLTWVLIALFSIAALTAALTVGVVVSDLLRHRATRVARHESIPAYYRHLVLAH